MDRRRYRRRYRYVWQGLYPCGWVKYLQSSVIEELYHRPMICARLGITVKLVHSDSVSAVPGTAEYIDNAFMCSVTAAQNK